MKSTENIEILKKCFKFLTVDLNFKLTEVRSFDYALYAKFESSNVGVYFSYEFREYIPDVQITKNGIAEFKERPGIYTIKELYKNSDFKLQSFYISEILMHVTQKEYRSYFQNIKTIEDAVKISAELVKSYAIDLIQGNDVYFNELNEWFKKEISAQ